MRKGTVVALSVAMILSLCACGNGTDTPDQQQTTSAAPTLSSIVVTYSGSTEAGTTISDLDSVTVEGHYSDGQVKTGTDGCELESPVTLEDGKTSQLTVKCGDVTASTSVEGVDTAKREAEAKQKAEEEAAAQKKAEEEAAAKEAAEKKAAEEQAAQQKAAQEQSKKKESSSTPSQKQTQQSQSSGTVKGGAFCSSEGATGKSSAGNTLTCKVASDGRLRWKK